METLLVPIALAILAIVVLVADIAPAEGESRGIGALAAAGFVAIFGLTFVAPTGTAFDGAWSNDLFTLYAQRLLLVAGALACIGAIDHADRGFPRRQGEYYLLLVSSVLGMALLAGARELVLLIVSFELMSIPQYVLAAIQKDGKRGAEGATKLYLTGAISAGLTVYGASFLVGVTGGTSLAAIASAPTSPMLVLGAMLVLAGFAYKLGAVPFHMWIPDTYQVAPTPFVAFLSVGPKVAVMAALVRISTGHIAQAWAMPLLVLCVLTLLLGNILAIPQTNVRRLLAWSGIGHAGLLLLALMVGGSAGAASILFYLATYVVSNMGAFFVTEAVGSRVGDDIPAWNGLARRSPGLALAMLLCLLSLGGIPFVAGFWGKLFLFRAAWLGGQEWLVAAGVTLSVVSLFYYLKVARAIYVEPPADPSPIAIGRPTLVAVVLALLGVVGLGVVPGPLWDAAAAAGAAVIGG
jgi:NADH-quinone oxidoreductase subunit N